MQLSQQIIRLSDTALEGLDASHNYHVHTKRAWNLVKQLVRHGGKFTIRSLNGK